MEQEKLNKTICAIVLDVVEKLDIEDIIRCTMIDHGVHPFADEVTDTQVHVAFNQIYQKVVTKLKKDY